VPIGTIEEIWLFPSRRIVGGESTVFVVAAFEPEPDQRRVITARYTVTRDRKGTATVQEQLAEHGTAPAAAVTRIVSGVLHRMDEEGEQPPRAERIERDQERWWNLIEELGGQRPAAEPGNPERDQEDAAAGEARAAAAGAGADGEQQANAEAGPAQPAVPQSLRPMTSSQRRRRPADAVAITPIDGEPGVGYQ
jgi:hypothetical protein